MLRCIKQLFVNKHQNLNQPCIKQFSAFERRSALKSPIPITMCMALNSYETLIIFMAINSQEGTVVLNPEVHLTVFGNKHQNLNHLCIKQFCVFERRRALNSTMTITMCMALNSYETLIIFISINSSKGTVIWNLEVH